VVEGERARERKRERAASEKERGPYTGDPLCSSAEREGEWERREGERERREGGAYVPEGSLTTGDPLCSSAAPIRLLKQMDDSLLFYSLIFYSLIFSPFSDIL
jgi:hypothetical protein